MKIRAIAAADQAEWLRMREALWPGEMEEHLSDTAGFFAGGSPYITAVFVLDRERDGLGAFIELNLRPYAEGCTASPVPHVEGWYVDADLRGQGWGKALIAAAEGWAIGRGFHEMTSDAEIDNTASIAAHHALGFEEAERIVCFVKRLDAG